MHMMAALFFLCFFLEFQTEPHGLADIELAAE
jgi:hypothetical protein